MPLEYWIFLWKCVLVGGLSLFTMLAIVVTIGGARDAVKLLRQLENEAAKECDDE